MIVLHGALRLCRVMLFGSALLAPSLAWAQADQPHPAGLPSGQVSLPVLHIPPLTASPDHYGPYNAHVLTGGRGLQKPLFERDPLLGPQAPWTLSAWLKLSTTVPDTVSIAGAGNALDDTGRSFALVDGKAALKLGGGNVLIARQRLDHDAWHWFVATYDGKVARLYVDGAEAASRKVSLTPISPVLQIAPVTPPTQCSHLPCAHFGGFVAELTLAHGAQSAKQIADLAQHRPDPELIMFEDASKPWPIQSVQYIGNQAPQPPSMMPKRIAPFSTPHAKPLPPATTTMQPVAAGDWILHGGWMLAEAPKVSATAQALSTPGFDAHDWMPATVPGTVLTTMIDRGRYPDPNFGMDNLAIPERLNRQDYWYRAEFEVPASASTLHQQLVFDGINYRAEVWCNGKYLGDIDGAFNRGVFDVSKVLHASGKNAIAIRISPVPHPGIPNVQSIALGSGLNGGAMGLDGPTFLASEGWDWNPPMHDRNTGLWQPVHLVATGGVEVGDAQVITQLPLPDISSADVTINVPLRNFSDTPLSGTLHASFEGVTIDKQVTVPAGGTTVALTPGEFHALHLEHPRLWWPNGYGKPALYHLNLSFSSRDTAPSQKSLRFGVREISYELSVLDNNGDLRRVDYDPTLGRTTPQPQIDVTHEAMRQVPGGWASSIAKGVTKSPALRTIDDTRATPDLILRVNGVRIAVRGGSWGMDDSRKRVSRARLEPYFRLEHDANLNMIRNWQGQNTEKVFYDLADEYGMLVWNDFWEVTTDSNVEAEDPQLFLANARDTLLRYRNHPSIVMWCGRNEGVPQPIINRGLIRLIHQLDGTRYYSPSSNQVNLEPSGPYSYQAPADYYDKVNLGFAVEVGTPSLPTLEWFGRWLPKQDQWPITDAWAYHNWHPHNDFTRSMAAQFGPATSLAQYVSQAQMMNYADYRAIFEGFNAHLWAPNGGRLLWMTHPSWPSMLWGIMTSDYDTQASYYATRKASEPLHVQLDLRDNHVQVINTTRQAQADLDIDASVYALDGKRLLHVSQQVDARADDVTDVMPLDLASLLGDTTRLVYLTLHDAHGTLVSRNLYWRAASESGYRALNGMQRVHIAISAQASAATDDGMRHYTIRLQNTSAVPALNIKLGAFNTATHKQILPAYFSDNYVSLVPGEQTTLTLELPTALTPNPPLLKLRGWNIEPDTLTVH